MQFNYENYIGLIFFLLFSFFTISMVLLINRVLKHHLTLNKQIQSYKHAFFVIKFTIALALYNNAVNCKLITFNDPNLENIIQICTTLVFVVIVMTKLHAILKLNDFAGFRPLGQMDDTDSGHADQHKQLVEEHGKDIQKILEQRRKDREKLMSKE